MFYQELLKISKSGAKVLSDELIEEIDIWLATLPNNLNDKITVSRFSAKFGLDYQLARSILERLCELSVLERLFAILCPECGHILRVTDERNLLEDMTSISFCYACNESVSVEAKDIEIRYKLIKQPNDPDKMKRLSQDILGEKSVNPQDRIDTLIKEGNYNTNNLFYKPTEEEYAELKLLFRGLSAKHENTTEHGNSLEDLVIALLNLVKPFTANKARTSINQIDCLVRNRLPFPSNILSEIGNLFYCECKNEKKEPGNTYFHKLNSILVLSQNGSKDRRFGIVFSIKKPAKTAFQIAKKTFQNQNIILISFYKEEIEDIINNNINLLDVIEMKANQIIHDITSDLKEIGLYK